MTTHTLRRWGAVLVAGSLCMGIAYLFYPSTAHSGLIRPAAGLALVGVLMLLPARERDVLHLLARGRSNPQIAAHLGLSRKTTSNYVSSILTKLQVRDRAEAGERARRSEST